MLWDTHALLLDEGETIGWDLSPEDSTEIVSRHMRGERHARRCGLCIDCQPK